MYLSTSFKFFAFPSCSPSLPYLSTAPSLVSGMRQEILSEGNFCDIVYAIVKLLTPYGVTKQISSHLNIIQSASPCCPRRVVTEHLSVFRRTTCACKWNSEVYTNRKYINNPSKACKTLHLYRKNVEELRKITYVSSQADTYFLELLSLR